MKLLSIIIPVFNEEKRLGKTFEALNTLSLPRGLKLQEVIFVDDGSQDKTKNHIKKFRKSSKLPVRLISYSQNRGKGYAVKIGMLSSTGEYSLLCDADMSTPFSELEQFMPYVRKGSDVVIGTRKNGKSTVIIHQPWLRENLGKLFTRFTQFALQLNTTDFTCGFKLFNTKAINTIFPKSVINRWGYDAEILYIASKDDLKVSENHVVWSNDELSHVNVITAIPNTLIEIAKIILVHRVIPFIRTNTAKNPFSYIQRIAQKTS